MKSTQRNPDPEQIMLAKAYDALLAALASSGIPSIQNGKQIASSLLRPNLLHADHQLMLRHFSTLIRMIKDCPKRTVLLPALRTTIIAFVDYSPRIGPQLEGEVERIKKAFDALQASVATTSENGPSAQNTEAPASQA